MVFSALGYDSLLAEGIAVLAPRGAVVTGYRLQPEVQSSITLDSVSTWIEGYATIYGRLPNLQPDYRVKMYFGRRRDVSARWEDHVLDHSRTFDGFNGGLATHVGYSTLQYPYVPPGKAGLHSGDSFYAIAYTGNSQIFDTTTRSYRYEPPQ